MQDIIRIVLCQLECHPSFFIDKLAFIEEPFVPEKYSSSLSSLAGSGIPGLVDLQTTNKSLYLEWHQRRIQEILSHPLLNDDVPCILIFSEGSIPIEALKDLVDYSNETGSIVIAGTHGIQNTIDSRRIYRKLGKEKAILKKSNQGGQVSFVFSGSKIYSRNKQFPSVFELTDTSSLSQDRPKLYPFNTKIRETPIAFMPLVCAEALQDPLIQGDFDILNIISYTQTPNFFSPYIDSHVQRSKICTYLNDGKFGQSYIKFPLDKRHSSWFFEAPLHGKLPPGECILIIDMSISHIAPNVGVTNPKSNYSIKLLSSITYSDSMKKNQDVAVELAEISKIEQSEARKNRLNKVLKNGYPDNVQKAKILYLEELARNGVDVEEHWNCYGQDIIINQIGLIDLEAKLSKNCYDCLLPLLTQDDFDNTTEQNLKSFLKNCKIKGKNLTNTPDLQCEVAAGQLQESINREWECSRILSFFDNRNEIGIQIAGLLNIGKSSTILKAIGQTGIEKVNKIEIGESSTVQYLYEKTVGNPWHDKIPGDAEIFSLLSESNVKRRISDWDLIWFENCENLLTGGGWRSEEVKQYINAILRIAQESKTKLIFETTYELPFDVKDPSIIGRLRIKGFEGKFNEHGIALFNKQLRRLDLSPDDLGQSEKETLINKIGGHPMAIIFCADAIYEEGYENVSKALENGGGFYQKLINKLLHHVNLTDEQETILRLLEGSNYEVQRDLISSVCPFPATEHIYSLIKQCLIEIVSPDTIRLPGVLKRRFRFRNLSQELKNKFHSEATKFFGYLAKKYPSKIEYLIASEMHADIIGAKPVLISGFLDSKIAQAKLLYDDRKYRDAKHIIDEICKIKQSRDILRLSILIDAELGLHKTVIEKAKTVFAGNPHDSYLFRKLCKITLTQSRDDITEELVTIAQNSKIDEISIFVVQGDIARRRKQLNHAEWYYREAVNSDYKNKNAWPYFFLGVTLIKLNEIDEAIDILHEGLIISEKWSSVNSSAGNAIKSKLGMAYMLTGNLAAGQPIIQNLIEQSPEDPEIVHVYAYLIVKKYGIEKAEEAYAKFRKVKPRSWRQKSHYNLFFGLFLLEIGKIAEANDHLALAHKYELNNVYIMVKYAETLLQLAMQTKSDDNILAEEYAKKCGQIIVKIKEFDKDNKAASLLTVDLHYEFGIELTSKK